MLAWQIGVWAALIGILGAVGARLFAVARRHRAVPVSTDDDEIGAGDFVHDMIAALAERGIVAEPVPDTFALYVAGGHWLDLRPPFPRYAAATRVQERAAVIQAQIEAWEGQDLLLTEAGFGQRAAAALNAAGFDVTVDADASSLLLPHVTLSLTQPWSDAMHADPAEVIDELVARAKRLREGPVSLDDAVGAMMVEVLPRAQVSAEILQAMMDAGPATVEHWSLRPRTFDVGDRLVGRPALLQGAVIRPMEPFLDAWGVSMDEALEHLAAKLEASGGGRPVRSVAPGVLMSSWEDPRDASVLLLGPEGLEELGLAAPAVIWPLTARHVYLASDAEDGPLERMLDHAEASMPVASPLSLVPLIRAPEGGWVALTRPPGHPLAARLAALAVQQGLADYRQVEGLLAELASRGRHPPPARVRVQDGQTVATWSGPALLPLDIDAIEVGVGARPLVPPRELARRLSLSEHWVEPAYAVASVPPSIGDPPQ